MSLDCLGAWACCLLGGTLGCRWPVLFGCLLGALWAAGGPCCSAAALTACSLTVRQFECRIVLDFYLIFQSYIVLQYYVTAFPSDSILIHFTWKQFSCIILCNIQLSYLPTSCCTKYLIKHRVRLLVIKTQLEEVGEICLLVTVPGVVCEL